MQAKQARKAQAMIGNPSKKDFRGMVSNHLVANCPVGHANITNPRQTFGPDLVSIPRRLKIEFIYFFML